jgi:hypothetical protein
MRPNAGHLSKTGEEEQNGAREILVGCHEGERIHRHDQNAFEKVCGPQQAFSQNRGLGLGSRVLPSETELLRPELRKTSKISCPKYTFENFAQTIVNVARMSQSIRFCRVTFAQCWR